ncbi:DUF4166 domain-containing protein [Micromonospora krabiensis]|uniref:DUF4166 domain-containing protein n=1 Tax=Micromonospora krabiensis TaxID=307121 RepID=A0A1C3NCT1_9ACTN|nr:DUF4166 domain-containing protein [Micromonospora krabiensis]SBV30404.1 protein of unknown function [Micromonospora krabiensis]
MTSVFQRALGADFDRLHPQLRRRFGVDGRTDVGCVGSGVMTRVWRGPAVTAPLLRLGTLRHVLFPETGVDVPFTIENYAYIDSYRRPTLTFVRTFQVTTHRRRRFDATMVWSERRGTLVDYLGTHQHLAVDLRLGVDETGALTIRSGGQRFRGGLPCPAALTGHAHLREWYDDRHGRFGIEVKVSNPLVGPVFGYSGTFTVSYLGPDRAPVPAAVRPLRENPRD